MVSAVLFAVVAMLCWGLWAVLANAAMRSLSPAAATVISYGIGAAIALGYLLLSGDVGEATRESVGLAVAAGVFVGAAALAFYAGLAAGRTAVVATIGSLYFVVAAVVGVLVLGESLGPTDLLGIGFAVAAVVLLSQ